MRRAWSRAACLGAAASLCTLLSAHGQTPPDPVAPQPNAPPPADTGSPDRGGPQITITLTSGEVIKGTIKSVDEIAVVIIHPVLGDVRVPRSGIAKSDPQVDQILAPPPPPAPTPPPAKPEPQPEPQPEPKPEPKPEPPKAEPPKPPPPPPEKKPAPPKNPLEAIFAEDEKSFWLGWSRNVELGMNGTTGPFDSQTYRAYVNLNRATGKMGTTASFTYVYSEGTNGKYQDRGEVSSRTDFRLSDTPWSFWVSGRGEVDDLARWDGRVSAATGIGYNFVKTEKLQLTGRLGVGGAREINGRNEIIPEVGIFAFNADYKLNDKASFYASTEYNPSGKHWDWDNFRSVTRAGMQYVIDPTLKMTLRLGAEFRHDSEVPSSRTNQLDYFLTLGFAF